MNDQKSINSIEIEETFVTSKSKQKEAYEIIKQLIISNKLTPGTLLVESQLSKLLNISRTPIRAALSALINDKLVEYIPGRSMVVSSITIDDVVEIYEIREVIDVLALRLFLRNINIKHIENLKNYVRQMELALERRDFQKFIQHDMDFHDSYLNNTGNKRLGNIVKSLHDEIRRFLSVAGDDEIKSRNSLQDHQKIVEAIENGKFQEAESCLFDHITTSRDYHLQRLIKKTVIF